MLGEERGQRLGVWDAWSGPAPVKFRVDGARVNRGSGAGGRESPTKWRNLKAL